MIVYMVALIAAPTTSDPLVDAVARCLTVTARDARLACLDTAARALVDGVERREIAVVRREEVQRVRRSLFGIDGTPGNEPSGAIVERLEALDTTVVAATRGGNDQWTVRLAEGGRWQTTEAWLVGREPKPGVAASIRRGALGAYILKIGNERAVRVRRIN